MKNNSSVYVRIDTNLKENAEGILTQLAITPSSAIQIFYTQIVLHKGIPFDLRLLNNKPSAVESLTQEELDFELQKGIDSIESGNVYTADEVDVILNEKFSL